MNEMMLSPWSEIPRQEVMPVAPQPLTPDMTYPSFPNPAQLGLQIPYPEAEPVVVPVHELPFDPLSMAGEEMQMSPWALMQIMGQGG